MSQPTFPISQGHSRPDKGGIVVELGTQPLPLGMRLAGLRSSVRVPAPGRQVMQRLLMAPVAMMLRVFSR